MEENNDLKERNETLDAEFNRMSKIVEEKDEEMKRLRGQIREGPIKRSDFNKLQKDYKNLDAHCDDLQQQLDAAIKRKDEYKDMIREKDEEVKDYHEKMKTHMETNLVTKDVYTDCLKSMENLKIENQRMTQEVNVKWRQALDNSERRYQYFLHQKRGLEQQMERMRNDLQWKDSELQVRSFLSTTISNTSLGH